jgi:presenilin-like A22 family membrane protease
MEPISVSSPIPLRSFSHISSLLLKLTTVGNVKVAGMPEAIGASEAQYSTAVSIFFVTYILVEIPCVILVKRFKPRYILTGLCIIWTAATIANGFITNVGGLCLSSGSRSSGGWSLPIAQLVPDTRLQT